MKEPKTLLDVPPSVAFELLVPLNPFSTSSIQRQGGAIAKDSTSLDGNLAGCSVAKFADGAQWQTVLLTHGGLT
jgi:hypothetical protein